MEREVQQLVDMGATPAQARAALKKYNDVMQAAERIFDGAFDHITDDSEDVEMKSVSERAPSTSITRTATPDDDEDGAGDDDEDGYGDDAEEDDDENEYMDYDSDYEPTKGDSGQGASTADPYAGIFFSKDRREEVIEVEEDPDVVTVSLGKEKEKVKLMTQGQWMKGCPEGGEQGFLFSQYHELSEGRCPCPHGCGATVPRQKQDFFALFSDFSTYIMHLRKIAPRKCATCRKPFCFACGEPMSEADQKDSECLFHCPNLQGVILGVGLAMVEETYLDERLEKVDDKIAKPAAGRRRKAADTPSPHGSASMDDDDFVVPGIGKKAKLGTGYAGDVREDHSGQIEALAAQKLKDEKLANLLKSVRMYLPNLNRDGGGKSCDYLPHPTTLAHLRRRFNFVSSQLLRNDSLLDMSERSALYFELLEWLETISCHEALASMMAMPIMVPSSVKSVTTRKSSKSGPQIRERTIVYEGSSGPRELLEAIVIQAQAAMKGLEAGAKAAEGKAEMTEDQKRQTSDDKGKGKDTPKVSSEENAKLLGFCKRILGTAKAIDRSLRETKGDKFVERLHAALPKIPGTSRGQEGADVIVGAKDSDEDVEKAYVDWAGRVRFEYCDLTIPPAQDAPEDETPHYKFFYNTEARMLANSDIPRRSLAIAKELAVLTTNLPVAWNSSIFLRVDETRVDVIKALITGPEGTPYYNGCYLFDIFLGPSYNQSPPSVKYMTTNGGKYRFNPNLYADGKVCLSLLGTWSGPGWVAGRSTLLQVLISIQSMILCDEPYLNEPAWASCAGTAQSKAYSANVRRMVVRTAMLNNLKNPVEPFEDVIRTHFRLKARSITKQLDEWLEEDDGRGLNSDGGMPHSHGGTPRASSSGNGFREDVEELKSLLARLAAGEDISEASSSRS
ncbi:ubiquitin conjugating enzyme family protein [Phanerochaete sordida]|uniref:Ubiquitin conjugating enzyme family protein n=1 Tax=Phanerochaete sordida TaxID=48140 RepID=A0A9P3L9Q4_9APHY|nr:ubiquitin conjugating enzyme family protein [Phanerochaete sordida]